MLVVSNAVRVVFIVEFPFYEKRGVAPRAYRAAAPWQ
jgi:hypothetical protein